jgi:hypothetical protein
MSHNLDLENKKYQEEILEQYSSKFTMLDWLRISIFQTLSEHFIEKYADKWDWVYISRYQTLSESFMEKYKDKVDWYWISRHQKMSEDFIIKNLDRIRVERLKGNPNVSKTPRTYCLLTKQ